MLPVLLTIIVLDAMWPINALLVSTIMHFFPAIQEGDKEGSSFGKARPVANAVPSND